MLRASPTYFSDQNESRSALGGCVVLIASRSINRYMSATTPSIRLMVLLRLTERNDMQPSKLMIGFRHEHLNSFGLWNGGDKMLVHSPRYENIWWATASIG